MDRRLLIRLGFACGSICLLSWRLPALLDRTFSSIEQHSGTIAMLRGGGLSIPGANQPAEAPKEVQVLGVASALSPAERAKLLDAARAHDPLAKAEATLASRVRIPAKTAEPTPASKPETPAGVDPALAAALKALGLDPASIDMSSVDVDALLAQARGDKPKH